MGDIKISRHQLREDVIYITVDKEYDQYQDASAKETGRYKKQTIVTRNPDLFYVQELYGGILEDDGDKIPWVVTMTKTGLHRPPTQEDCFWIKGQKYVISKVKPINRYLDAMYDCLIYPERNHKQIDALAIYDVKVRHFMTYYDSLETAYQNIVSVAIPSPVVVLDLVYGGRPTLQSTDGLEWLPFTSYVLYRIVPEQPATVYLKDARGTITTKQISW